MNKKLKGILIVVGSWLFLMICLVAYAQTTNSPILQISSLQEWAHNENIILETKAQNKSLQYNYAIKTDPAIKEPMQKYKCIGICR